MGQRTAERAPVADLRVADQPGHVGQDRHRGPQQRAPLQVVMAGERADGDMVAGVTDERQPADPADVDEDGRRGEAEHHERQERMPAGQQLGVVAVLGEQCDGVVGGVGPDVVELGRDHALAFAAANTDCTML